MRVGLLALLVAAVVGCEQRSEVPAGTPASPGPAAQGGDAPPKLSGELVLYTGRSLGLTKPLIRRFEQQTGVKVKVRDGSSGELAALLVEEGDKSPADVFWAQDADSLGLVEGKGLLADLPEDVGKSLVPPFARTGRKWVPTSGRARTLAYAPARIAEADLPKTVFDLTDPKYKGRVGWAPSNASFQAFVTALRQAHGEEKAEAWLRGMVANEAKAYPKNTPIIHALAAGEIDVGLPNHYYLLREKKASDKYPVDQTFFEPAHIGNLVNVAGVGVLKSAKNPAAAEAFVRFLVSPVAQQYFTSDVLEYPVTAEVIPNPALADVEALQKAAPDVDLNALQDVTGTLDLLRKVGVL